MAYKGRIVKYLRRLVLKNNNTKSIGIKILVAFRADKIHNIKGMRFMPKLRSQL